jgi:hypothetical protein
MGWRSANAGGSGLVAAAATAAAGQCPQQPGGAAGGVGGGRGLDLGEHGAGDLVGAAAADAAGVGTAGNRGGADQGQPAVAADHRPRLPLAEADETGEAGAAGQLMADHGDLPGVRGAVLERVVEQQRPVVAAVGAK